MTWTAPSNSLLLYADDIVILAPSVSCLQQLLQIYEEELSWLDMSINVNKSACIRVGPRFKNVCSSLATSDGRLIFWEDKVWYLGVHLVSEHLSCIQRYIRESRPTCIRERGSRTFDKEMFTCFILWVGGLPNVECAKMSRCPWSCVQWCHRILRGREVSEDGKSVFGWTYAVQTRTKCPTLRLANATWITGGCVTGHCQQQRTPGRPIPRT